MRIFDAHAHYDDGRFEGEYEGGYMQALRDARRAGVEAVVNSGACLRTSKRSIEIAEAADGDAEMPRVYTSVGIHPTETSSYTDINRAIDELRALTKHRSAVAVGEIGLDYHYPDETDKPAQHELFVRQLKLARELSMPVVIHTRDASGDTFEILRDYTDLKIMLHCYSGSAEMARQYADMGFYFSFGGVLTFKNAHKTKEALLAIPRDKIIMETDCPYLAPAPHRGEVNYSGYLPLVAEAIGETLGICADEAAETAFCNAERFFGTK